MVLTHLLKDNTICGGNSGYGLSPVANPPGTGAQQFASPTSHQGWEPGHPAHKVDAHWKGGGTKEEKACLHVSPKRLPLVKFWWLEKFGSHSPSTVHHHWYPTCISRVLVCITTNTFFTSKLSWATAAALEWNTFADMYVYNWKFSRFSINWWLLI